MKTLTIPQITAILDAHKITYYLYISKDLVFAIFTDWDGSRHASDVTNIDEVRLMNYISAE